MLQLPNGCSSSYPSIHPRDWDKPKASLKKSWYLQYYFYKRGEKGKLVIVKGNLNKFKTLTDRREAAKIFLSEITKLLKEGYDPTKKEIVSETINEFDIGKSTPWLQALTSIAAKLKLESSTASDLRSCLQKVERASDKLLLSHLPIQELKRKQIKLMLDYLERKEVISAHMYNKIRTYLLMLFKELLEYEIVDYNPIRDISKRKTVKRIRKTLTERERCEVNNHLRKNYYSFWRFMQIFFHSGARIKELLAVKVKDVDIKKQQFKVLIRKGRNSHEEWRVIKNIALPFWTELLEGAKENEYIFSIGLNPGEKQIIREQITRRWNTHVKKKLGITADFYSLKHLNLDEISGALDIEAAAMMAGHTSPVITMKHYAVNEKEREMERLRKVNNKFS